MTITKEQIESRRAQLQGGLRGIEAQIAKLQADREATAGAIQDCEHWLAVIDQPEPPAAPGQQSGESRELTN